jgi:hypothetical protein
MPIISVMDFMTVVPSVLVGLIGTVSFRRRLAAFGERERRSRRRCRRREPLLIWP